jgi:hypothetical protein
VWVEPIAFGHRTVGNVSRQFSHSIAFSDKELVNNKSLISCEFGNGAVIPLRQVIVTDDGHVLFEIHGVLASGLVSLVQNPHWHAQAGRGLRTCDAGPCDVHRVAAHSLVGAGDVRAYPVCSRQGKPETLELGVNP